MPEQRFTELHSFTENRPLRGFEMAQLLLGANVFYDQERTRAAAEGAIELDEARQTFCNFALRALAIARHQARQHIQSQMELSDAATITQWNESWLTASNLRKIYKNNKEMRKISRQLVLLNNLEREGAAPKDPLRKERLRDHQNIIFDEIVDGVFRKRPRPKYATEDPIVAAGGVVAPTGAGKTALAGELLYRLGIGNPPGPEDTRPLKALFVTVNQDMVNQMIGVTGNNTFRRFLGDEITVTPYFQHEKNAEGDVVVVNDDSLLLGLEQGTLDLDAFDIVIVDEAHHLLEPRVRNVVSQLGPTVVAFTATPAYEENNELRDLRYFFEVVSERNILQWTLDGLLNGAQIFTIKVEDPSDVNKTVVQLAQQMVVEKNRNVVVYAKAGGDEDAEDHIKCYHARWIADQLQAQGVMAASVGMFQHKDKNARLIREFDADELDVLTTVGKLKEGWDSANANVIIIARNVASPLELQQIVGRGTRLNEQFPVTIFFEVTTGNMQCSIWGTYGIEEIEQGVVVGGYKPPDRFIKRLQWIPGARMALEESISSSVNDKSDESDELTAQIMGESDPNTATSPPINPEKEYGKFPYSRLMPKKQEAPPPPVTLDELPVRARLGAEAVNYHRVREALIVNRREHEEPPEGYIALSQLAKEFDMPPAKVAYRLVNTDHVHVGLWQRDPQEGRLVFERYFEPQAAEYLRQHPFPPLMSEGDVTLKGMTRHLQISYKLAARIIEEEGLQGQVKGGTAMPNAMHYSPEQFAVVAEVVSLIPWAEVDDVRAEDLTHELKVANNSLRNLCEAVDVKPKRKRYRTPLGDTDFAQHISAEDAEKIRQEHHQYPAAQPSDVTIQEIAKRTNVNYTTASRTAERLADKGDISLLNLRALNNNRPTRFVSAEDAAKIEAEIQPVFLPPHLVPQRYLGQLINLSVHGVSEALKHQKEPPVSLKLPRVSGGVYCFPWKAVKFLAERSGWREGAEVIDFDMLPEGPDDTDPVKIAFARKLQERLVPAEYLGPTPTPKGSTPPAQLPPRPSPPPPPPVRPHEQPRRRPSPSHLIQPNAFPQVPAKLLQPISTDESLDAEEIGRRFGLSTKEVEAAIARADMTGVLPARSKPNKRGVVTPHYTKLGLRALCIEIGGIHPEGMQVYLGIPAPAIRRYLQNRGHSPTGDGRYDRMAWIDAQREFRRPPQGYIALMEAATFVSQSETAVYDFVIENGGKVEEFYNDYGRKVPYLPPMSFRLVSIQSVADVQTRAGIPGGVGRVPLSYRTREEIAKISDKSPEHFDHWLEGRLKSPKQIRWARVRTRHGQGEKILPHYDAELWKLYLREQGVASYTTG